VDRHLVLAAQTLATTDDFAERVAATASAGFTAMGLRPEDYTRAREAGTSDAQLRDIIDDYGVSVDELSVLRNWARSGDSGERSRRSEDVFWAMAEALGGQYMMAVSEVDGTLEEAAERFAGVCDRAAAHGLKVAVEFLPWTSIPDAATAWEIVRLADRRNGGVLVDSWHHFRGARDEAMLQALPP
jgi:sugar phosphate isomerase/epimerase